MILGALFLHRVAINIEGGGARAKLDPLMRDNIARTNALELTSFPKLTSEKDHNRTTPTVNDPSERGHLTGCNGGAAGELRN